MATNDEMRLKLTVSKMNVHRSTNKLQTIAAKCIVRNLDSFLDPKASKKLNVKLLPSALRNIVFQQWLMSHSAMLKKPQIESLSQDDCVKIFEKRMEVIQSLLCCHTLEVDLTPFIKDKYNSLSSEHLLKFLNFIGAKDPNLKVLTLSDNGFQNVKELNRTLCNAISKLHNLKSLNIGSIFVYYTNLKAMCKNLESLTHLYTNIVFNPNFDESNQREIEDLQIFSNLIVFEHGNIDEKFTINCIQHLPKLRYIDSIIKAHMIEELLDRCPNQKFALTDMPLLAWSNKEIHLSFPDLTNLQIVYPRRNFIIPNLLLKFSKIENLTLTRFPSIEKFIPCLDAYGHGLHSLKINNCSGQFKLSSILDRCPKLQSLFLDTISLLPECSRPDIHSFSTGLKELFFKCSVLSNGQAPLLLDILSFPTLECVTLKMGCKYFHLGDIERLTTMIASRKILRDLKRLCIFVFEMESDPNYRAFRVLSDFIKSASAFLPHLTEIKTDILSNIMVGMNSEASLEVATLKNFLDVYENF